MKNMLIIPDCHGRPFWKKAVEENFDKVDKIIFLGDYLDPYPWEGITRKEAIKNFQEIIDFKSNNKDKIILLIGNHDEPYAAGREFYTRSRYDSSNAWHIKEMFKSHGSLFQLAHETKIGDKTYLFTHAGLVPQWYEKHKELIGELTIENLNKLQETTAGIKALCEVSHYRGGYDKFGSIVWAHVDEIQNIQETLKKELPWDFQIIGHSQQEEHPIIGKDFACLDCRKAFILNEDNTFTEL